MDDLQSFSRPTLLILFLFVLFPAWGSAQDLSEALKEASVLELQGHYSQALDAYQNVLALPGGESLPQPRIKAAFLALDLGRWATAQTLAEPLVHSADLSAAQLGLVALMRSYRLTHRAPDAWSAFETWRRQHPQCPLTWNLAWEAFHCAEHIPSVSLAEMNRFQAILNTKPKGLSVYLQKGQAESLPLPPAIASTAGGRNALAVLQLGVFRIKENAKNETQRLRSQGWHPQLIKSRQAGFDLYLVQILSHSPQADLKRLKALGYEPYLRQGLLPDPEE